MGLRYLEEEEEDEEGVSLARPNERSAVLRIYIDQQIFDGSEANFPLTGLVDGRP